MYLDRAKLERVIRDALLSELARLSHSPPFVKRIEESAAAIASHPGYVRRRNEDRIALADIETDFGAAYRCAVVCDGVGGSDAGDVASSTAIAAFLASITASRNNQSLGAILDNAIRQADEVVRHELNGRGATTLCALLVSDSGDLSAASIGDSRIYAWNPSSHKLRQVSVDDTLENELRGFNLHNATVLDARGLRGSLSQALGESGRTSDSLRVSLLSRKDLDLGGAILATDGIWRSCEEAFNVIAVNCGTAEELARRSITYASWAGGTDNSSLLAIEDFSKFCSQLTPQLIPRKMRLNTWLGDTKFAISLLIPSENEKRTLHQEPIERRRPAKKKRIQAKKAEGAPELAFRDRKKLPDENIEVSSDERPEKS